MRAQITFKSGAQIEIDTDKVATKRNPLSGDITEFSWETPDTYTAKLFGLPHPENIEAIVILVDPVTEATEAGDPT